MHAVSFEGQNAVFTAPGCDDLPAFIDEQQGSITSAWQLSNDDIARLNENGGIVFLSVYCDGQPPVRLATESPF